MRYQAKWSNTRYYSLQKLHLTPSLSSVTAHTHTHTHTHLPFNNTPPTPKDDMLQLMNPAFLNPFSLQSTPFPKLRHLFPCHAKHTITQFHVPRLSTSEKQSTAPCYAHTVLQPFSHTEASVLHQHLSTQVGLPNTMTSVVAYVVIIRPSSSEATADTEDILKRRIINQKLNVSPGWKIAPSRLLLVCCCY
jgi:hypothetical protein